MVRPTLLSARISYLFPFEIVHLAETNKPQSGLTFMKLLEAT
jgi:hypothetical protein